MPRPLLPLPTKSPAVDPAAIITPIWVAWFDRVIKKLSDLELFPMIAPKYATAILSVEYTCPPSLTVSVSNFTAKNTDVVARTLTVHIVTNGDTPSASNKVVDALSIAAGAAIVISALENKNLVEGDTIRVAASVGDKIVIRSSGREVA